jgi:hypothetical protein
MSPGPKMRVSPVAVTSTRPEMPMTSWRVLGLLGVASAGRAVAEQDRDSLPGLRHAHHVRRRVLGEDGNLDVLEPGVTVVIGVQAGNRHHGAMMTPAPRG